MTIVIHFTNLYIRPRYIARLLDLPQIQGLTSLVPYTHFALNITNGNLILFKNHDCAFTPWLFQSNSACPASKYFGDEKL